MGNMPMKCGYNLRTLKMTHTRMGGDSYAYVSKLKFSKCFKISHTHILDPREHAPKVLAHLTPRLWCNTYAYVSKLEIWVYGWVFGLEIDKW